MGLWDTIYNSRVWVFAVALLWHIIGVAVLEAHNEASHIAAFALANLALVLGHWYAAYLGYRLWYKLPEIMGGRLPLVSKIPTPKRSPRDATSLWAWIDCWMMLIVVWAAWSQFAHVLWSHTFETPHMASNEWAAMVQWLESITSLAVSIPIFTPSHPAISGAYIAAILVFKIYDLLVFSIAFYSIYEAIKDRDTRSAKKDDDSIQATPPVSQHLMSDNTGYFYQQQQQQHSALPLPPPSGNSLYWNPNSPDELAQFLTEQHYAGNDTSNRPMMMGYGSSN